MADSAQPEAHPQVRRLVYAGLAMELLPDFEGWALGEEHASFVFPFTETHRLPTVRCGFSRDSSLRDTGLEARRIRWAFEGDRGWIENGLACVDLRRTGPGSFCGAGRISASRSGPSALLSALAGALVEAEGGLVLHAAAIVLDGRAILFVGPSGCGKTTSAAHAAGAAWLAKDRVAAMPGPAGWVAWGMAGGDAVDLPRAADPSYPIAAVLRPRRTEAVGVREAGASEAVHLLREATMGGGVGVEGEQRRLEAAIDLAGSVPVGTLGLELGRDVTPTLRSFLGGAS